MLLLPCPALAEFKLIPPKAVVVLVSGVAGDLESDALHTANLKNWSELAKRAEAERVIILCEDPEAQKLPTDSSITTLRADRGNFLGLERGLSGVTNPLVVVAWGHGGTQGRLPVLHVRGPRLTAADFKKVADSFGERPSTWLLMFRGSGTFARALAGPQRAILSSEYGTQFASDPAGLQVLTELAREQPEISLSSLAEAFGQEILRWYQGRNLARTEEPTLWLGTEEPRLLARDTAPQPPSTTGLAKNEPEGSHRTNAPVLPLNEVGPPPPWSGIARVRAEEYPGADAVVLRKRVSYTIGSSPAILAEQEQFIQILTPEGKRVADFDISYSPPFEEVNFLDCEILQPGGRLFRVNPEAVRETGDNDEEQYQAGRRRMFSLPGAIPGAILHVRYQNVWKKFPLPHVSLQIPMESRLPAVETTLEVTAPARSPLHFVAESLSAPDPEVKQGTYGTTYQWRFGPSSAALREVLSPPGLRPRMLISTFPDWRTLAEWYERMVRLADEMTPEIETKALELTKGASSDREKLLALYNYVTALRYVAVPLGVNSIRPHAAASVLRNQYGDCKDKANLLNTLLRSVKIPADLVLVPRFERAYESTPGFTFNHAISRVRLGTETLWLDTTDDICRFGLLPPGDPGRKVLVIDGKTTALEQLPQSAPEAHTLRLQGTINVSRKAASAPVTLVARGSGYSDYELRNSAREVRESATGAPLLAAMLRPTAGVFALEKQTCTAVSALGEDFRWNGEGNWTGLISAENSGLVLRAPFWVPNEWDLALHARKTPLFLNQGYPQTLAEEFHFSLPAGMNSIELPANASNQAQPLAWKITWENASLNRITAKFRAELRKGELSLAESGQMQHQLRDLFAAMAAVATAQTSVARN
jgi:transglutaminase-like putative cysteine protease